MNPTLSEIRKTAGDDVAEDVIADQRALIESLARQLDSKQKEIDSMTRELDDQNRRLEKIRELTI